MTEPNRSADATPPSEAVITAVAEHKGVEPVALSPPLYEVLDPDALDALFGTGGSVPGGRIEFRYAGCRVELTADGSVDVGDARE